MEQRRDSERMSLEMAVRPVVFAEAHEDPAELLELRMLSNARMRLCSLFPLTSSLVTLVGYAQREATCERDIAVHNFHLSHPPSPPLPFLFLLLLILLHCPSPPA